MTNCYVTMQQISPHSCQFRCYFKLPKRYKEQTKKTFAFSICLREEEFKQRLSFPNRPFKRLQYGTKPPHACRRLIRTRTGKRRISAHTIFHLICISVYFIQFSVNVFYVHIHLSLLRISINLRVCAFFLYWCFFLHKKTSPMNEDKFVFVFFVLDSKCFNST